MSLCVSLSKNINPGLVLVQPRKNRPFLNERLLMGHKESNQTNKLFSIELNTVTRNQYKSVVPLFGAAYATPNKGTTIIY